MSRRLTVLLLGLAVGGSCTRAPEPPTPAVKPSAPQRAVREVPSETTSPLVGHSDLEALDDGGARARWQGRLLRPDGGLLVGVEAQVSLEYVYSEDVIDGGFELTDVVPGRYRGSVGIFDCGESGEFKPSEFGDRVALFDVELQPGEDRVEDVRLKEGLPVTGVLQRPDGGPFALWWVKLSPPEARSERGIELGSLRAQTDERGRFEFSHVPPGRWQLVYGGPQQHRFVPWTVVPVEPGARDVVFRVVAE